MSTKFLSIEAVQRPFPIGLDPQARNQFSVNFNAVAQAPVVSWMGCVVALLVAAGLGTYGVDIWVGPATSLPAGSGPFIAVVDTGGTAPIRVHGGAAKYERLSVQLIVHATSYAVAEARAMAAYNALDGNFNITVAA